MNYVIIGNGTAAVGTIEGIRAVDPTGPITVISDEIYPVYGRPLISYLLLGKTTEDKMLHYRPADFYETNGVKTMLGRTVTKIDAAAKTVLLEGGEAVPYDKLCVCTGSRPFAPPMEGLDTVQNKTSFMTLDDAKRLNNMLGDQNDKRVLIIGAGLIGLKCAEGIYQRVKELTVIDLAPRILPNVLTEVPAAIIQKHIEGKGVQFILGDSVARFDGNTATLQSGGTIDFDILVIAVGVRPNTELAADAGCEVNRGILIDDHSATTVPDIYAAGDCTVSHDIAANTDRILAILPNAYMQGEAAGRNMAGSNTSFDKAIPMNASGFMGLHMITAGSYDGDTYLEQDEDHYKLLVTRDNHLVGFIMIGDVDRAGIYTSLIRERTPLDTIDFDLIREKPQLMAFSRAERAKKLGGAH
ncbi:MAG TPA: FAD-dependent oxidoreductase [Candidatus Agathobaculum merdipullorum]|nr:FAD-dependent oxidoreductase [Candidatus Agathobaculum merdipullorum]